MKNNPISTGRHLLFCIIMLATASFYQKTLASNCGLYANPLGVPNLQQSEVHGSITDTNGMPLAGVSIMVKGTQKGTVSDFNGSYSLRANTNNVLVFSFLGFKTQEIQIKDLNKLNVQLETDVTTLSTVEINAGYYTVKDKERTGNISRITAKDIETQPVANPLAAIQGRMAGVEVTQTSGVPGAGFNIKIRGQNSILAGNDPLYIIDGIPYGSETLGNIQVSGTIIPGIGISPLNAINPSDIESIEILKDADATAIYGSRGSNGVVLITTKKGTLGRTGFTLNMSSGFGRVVNMIDLIGTSDYLKLRQEAYANDGVAMLPSNAYDINGTWDKNRQTDWQKELFGKTAYLTNLQGTLSGGTERTRFLISGTYGRQTTVFPGDSHNAKASVLAHIDHASENNKLEVQLSLNYITDFNDLVSSDLIREAYGLAPNAPKLYNDNGSLNWENSTWNNPLRQLEATYRSYTNNLMGNTKISYLITENLKLSTSLGYNQTYLQEKKMTPSTIFNPALGRGSSYSTIRINDANRHSWIAEPQLDWTFNLGDTKIGVLAGMTFQEQKSNQLVNYARGFTTNSFIENIATASNVSILNNAEYTYKYQAVYGRIHINHKGKYLLNITGRRDGSSRFGPNKRFANFGAIGAAWIFSKEPFVETGMPFLSFGKLRGSYGTSGNDQIGDYQYLDSYSFNNAPYQGVIGLEPTRLFNPNFSWEINRKREVALELGFFKDRVLVSSSYYKNTSSNQLVGIPLPSTTGFSSLNANLNAAVENTGLELELQTVNIQQKNFSWTSALNITFPKNRLTAFPNLEGSTYANKLVIGEPLNIQKVYQLEGVNAQTGVYTFKDYNNDGVISSPSDNQVIRDLNAKFFGGLSNTIIFKGFELNFLFQFKNQLGKNYIATGIPGSLTSLPTPYLKRWQQPGDQTSIQRLTTGQNAEALKAHLNFLESTASIGDASFIRLKNISIAYHLGDKLLNGMGCNIYLQAQNMFTITNYQGLDPETQSSRTIPPLKIITIGTTLNF